MENSSAMNSCSSNTSPSGHNVPDVPDVASQNGYTPNATISSKPTAVSDHSDDEHDAQIGSQSRRRKSRPEIPYRFYSERNPVPKVEHFPWGSVVKGPMNAWQNATTTGNATVVGPENAPDSSSTTSEDTKTRKEENHIAEKTEGDDLTADGDGLCCKETKRKHAKTVSDPITRKEVTVVDAKYLPPQPIGITSPNLAPPTSWTQFSTEVRNLTLKYLIGIVLVFLLLSGLLRLHMSFPLFVSLGAILAWYRQVDSLWVDILFHDPTISRRHRRNRSSISSAVSRNSRGPLPSILEGGPESVEWLNNTIAKLWPQVNADLFKPVTDMLEDVMQASIPSIVQQIRIRDIGQGTQPVKILSMRWLEDGFKGEGTSDVDSEEEIVRLANPDDDQENIGEWASLEITFAFSSLGRGTDAASKAASPFLMVVMSLGLKGVVGAPEVPIWVQLRGLQGTCRLRVQLIPDPPFIKLTTFSLMGMPRIEISAIPLSKKFLNVMSLPVISDFVYSSIKTTAKEFCAPKSYTIDLSKLLIGDDTKKELLAIGVLVVYIDRAEGVRAADKLTGKSDCYVTLSYSKFAKTLWSSRIIFCDLNPVWDETAILLLNADEIKAEERLAVEIWDSDRFTVDDLLGRVEVDVHDLVKMKGKVIDRDDFLGGYGEGQVMPGKLKWSVGFYGKAGLQDQATRTVQDELDAIPNMSKTSFTPAGPAPPAPVECGELVTKVPPSPAYPSGILSIQVHNIVNLACQPILSTRTANQRIGVATTAEEEEEGETLPSSYCSIMLDYQKIYKTRVKPMTSKPFFNAGTERFVRDWTYSSVIVVVRDSRMREIDPILGVVELKLKDVFQNASVVSRYYPIQGGIGYGKIRISLLFRSIDTILEKPLLGAEIGSVEIVTRFISASSITDEEVRKAGSITFETPLIKKKAARSTTSVDGAEVVGWAPIHNTHGSTGFRLGVCHRHSAPCILYFKRDSSAFKLRRDKVLAAAKFWLKDIPDEEIVTLKLDVYKPEDMERFMQNGGTGEAGVGQKVGHVEFQVKFHRGLGKSHWIAARRDRDFEDVIKAVKAAGGNVRGEAPLIDDYDAGDEAGLVTDSEHEEAANGVSRSGTIKDVFSRSSSKRKPHSQRASGISVNGATTIGPSHPPTESIVADAHSSSSGNESDQPAPPPKHTRVRTMTNSEIRKEMNRRERGVMQWKGARTLAWVGRGVKDAGRGVKGKLAMGLGEGRDRRVGERGRNIGWSTEV